MTTPIVTGDVISVKAWCIFGAQAAVNTFNFQAVAHTGTGSTDATLATEMDLLMNAFYPTFLCDQAVYRGVQIYFMKRSGPFPPPVSSVVSTAPGVGGTNAIPKNTAMIASYETAVRGPGGRGRLFLPYLATDGMTPQGEPSGALITFVNAFITGLLTPTVSGTGPNTTTIQWVLLKIRKGQPVVPTALVTGQASGKMGQMHKRGDYGKPNQCPI